MTPDHDMAPEHGTITLEHHRRTNGDTPEPAPLQPQLCAGCGVKFVPDVFAQAFCSRRCRRASDPEHDATAKPGDREAEDARALAVTLIGQLLDTPGAGVVASLQVGRVRIVVEVSGA